MYQDTFLPITIELRIQSDRAMGCSEWQSRMGLVMDSYAKVVSNGDEQIIGHIKALLEFSAHCFIKFSCISSRAGAVTECFGNIRADEGRMIINSLVEERGLEESLEALSAAWAEHQPHNPGLTMAVHQSSPGGHSGHGHHHEHHHEDGAPCPVCGGHHHHQDHHHCQ